MRASDGERSRGDDASEHGCRGHVVASRVKCLSGQDRWHVVGITHSDIDKIGFRAVLDGVGQGAIVDAQELRA